MQRVCYFPSVTPQVHSPDALASLMYWPAVFCVVLADWRPTCLAASALSVSMPDMPESFRSSRGLEGVFISCASLPASSRGCIGPCGAPTDERRHTYRQP